MDLVERDECLEQDTILVFEVDGKKLPYSVSTRYFSNLHGFNDEIFNRLKLGKTEFCEMVYGHTPGGGDFPVCRSNWKKNAISMAWELFRRCEGNVAPPKEIPLTGVEKSFLDDVEVEEHNPFAFGTIVADHPFEERPADFVEAVAQAPEIGIDLQQPQQPNFAIDQLDLEAAIRRLNELQLRHPNPMADEELPI